MSFVTLEGLLSMMKGEVKGEHGHWGKLRVEVMGALKWEEEGFELFFIHIVTLIGGGRLISKVK